MRQVLTLKPNDDFPSQDQAALRVLRSGRVKGPWQRSLFMGFPGKNPSPQRCLCHPQSREKPGPFRSGSLSACSIAPFPGTELLSQQVSAFRNWGGGT